MVGFAYVGKGCLRRNGKRIRYSIKAGLPFFSSASEPPASALRSVSGPQKSLLEPHLDEVLCLGRSLFGNIFPDQTPDIFLKGDRPAPHKSVRDVLMLFRPNRGGYTHRVYPRSELPCRRPFENVGPLGCLEHCGRHEGDPGESGFPRSDPGNE